MMVRLFSRDAVAKSPCTCGSLPGIYILCCAQIQGQNCGKNAQGDPRPGEQKGVPREGKGCGRRAESDEAERSGKESRGRYRGDADLL